MNRLGTILSALLLILAVAAVPAHAQANRVAKLIVTVVDQTGAVIPNATVNVIGVDDKTKQVTIPPEKTSDTGIATFDRLTLGRYSIQGEFPGFDLGLLRDISLKAGDNKRVLVLPLQKFNQEVTVGREAQQAASDRASTFGTALTREQVESLSDDPDEMARQLNEMAGGNATIRVDSFEGQRLPPKAQIKAVHITRDMFAAENHSAGGMFIDIITQPGIGPLRGQGRFGFYDSALDGKNPVVGLTPRGQSRSFSGMLAGALIKEKSTFSLSVNQSTSFRTPIGYAWVNGQKEASVLNVRQPSNNVGINGFLDYALTKDQTMRISFYRWSSSTDNLGVGGQNLAERAFSTSNANSNIRIQEAGPIGRRFFINTRFYLGWGDDESHSVLEAPTLIVQGADGLNTRGGAQAAGGTHSRNFTLQSDLDYVRGKNSWRFGVELNGTRYRSDSSSNYLGTYTFASDADIAAGRAIRFTQRIGDPTVAYWNFQAGFYAQDDLRIRKNLTLSPGVRIEAQTHLHDLQNIGPRMGVTWSPWKSGKTTLRGSGGVFYEWLGTGTYENTLRVDGVHQRQVNMFAPYDYGVDPPQPLYYLPYPYTGPLEGAATDKYLLAPNLQMPRTVRLSAGVDQQLTKTFRIGMTYSDSRGEMLYVGQQLNPILAPNVYADPAFRNVIEAVNGGKSRARTLGTFFSWSLSPSMPGMTSSGPFLSWKRGLSMYGSYTLGKSENNTDGAFRYPVSGTVNTEWGPSSYDVRHRVNVSIYSNAIKNFTASISFNAGSATPYNWLTVEDLNGDGLTNDRMPGQGRNSLRSSGQWYSYGYFTYAIGLGKKKVTGGQGISVSSAGGGGFSVSSMAIPDQARYRLLLNVMVNNLTNHANYSDYNGIFGTPGFGKWTNASGVRTVNFSVGLTF